MPELNSDLRNAAVERLPSLDEKRYTVPSSVINKECHCSECWRLAVVSNLGIIMVTRKLLVAAFSAFVLPKYNVIGVDAADGSKQLHLLVPNVLSVERYGLLNGEEREHLQEVVLDYVADDSILVKVSASAFDTEVFRQDDLHVADVLAGPKGLENKVGEAQDGEVFDELLTEVVIDAVELVLRERLVQARTKLSTALQIVPKRLFNNHASVARVGAASVGGVLCNGDEDAGRDGEVENAVASEAIFGFKEDVIELLVVGEGVVLARVVEAAGKEIVHEVFTVLFMVDAAGKSERYHVAELLVAHLAASVAEDDEVCGETVFIKEGEERWENLLLSEVTGAANDNEGEHLVAALRVDNLTQRLSFSAIFSQIRGSIAIAIGETDVCSLPRKSLHSVSAPERERQVCCGKACLETPPAAAALARPHCARL